jgi:hypothetical protein
MEEALSNEFSRLERWVVLAVASLMPSVAWIPECADVLSGEPIEKQPLAIRGCDGDDDDGTPGVPPSRRQR